MPGETGTSGSTGVDGKPAPTTMHSDAQAPKRDQDQISNAERRKAEIGVAPRLQCGEILAFTKLAQIWLPTPHLIFGELCGHGSKRPCPSPAFVRQHGCRPRPEHSHDRRSR